MSLRRALDPLLRGDLVSWQGLPAATVADLEADFGPPEEHSLSQLGWYPATRYVFRSQQGANGLVLWAREGEAVMVEALRLPPVSVLSDLPAPSAILADEILVPDAYAHEYLYCEKGLVLTVAVPLGGETADRPRRILRCRGIRPLSRVEDFGPAYYQAFDDQEQLAGGGHG